eukprot:4752251-Pleurochrysis_carterae.AAC.3
MKRMSGGSKFTAKESARSRAVPVLVHLKWYRQVCPREYLRDVPTSSLVRLPGIMHATPSLPPCQARQGPRPSNLGLRGEGSRVLASVSKDARLGRSPVTEPSNGLQRTRT